MSNLEESNVHQAKKSKHKKKRDRLEDVTDENGSENASFRMKTNTSSTPDSCDLQTDRKQKKKKKLANIDLSVDSEGNSAKKSKKKKKHSDNNDKVKKKKRKVENTDNAETEVTPTKKRKLKQQNAEEIQTTKALDSEPPELTEEQKEMKRIKKEKMRKKKEKKKEDKLQEEENAASGITKAQTEAIQYLRKWHSNREQWNFQKVRQVWLLQNMYNVEKIPDSDFTILLDYLEGMKGKARELTLQEAEKLVDSYDSSVSDSESSDSEEKDSKNPDEEKQPKENPEKEAKSKDTPTSAEQYERARQVAQLLI